MPKKIKVHDRDTGSVAWVNWDAVKLAQENFEDPSDGTKLFFSGDKELHLVIAETASECEDLYDEANPPMNERIENHGPQD